MAPFRFCVASLIVAGFMTTESALALTAKDVTDKMSKEERFGYLTGIVDTISYQHVLNGERQIAQCVSDAFYKNKDGLSRMVEVLHAFPDKSPIAVLMVVLKKECSN